MKKIPNTKLVLLFLMVIMSFSLSAQESFQRLSDQSIKIIEGKVINQSSFKSEKNGYIYTSNTLEILKVFKGDNQETIEIITLGGTIDNQNQSWSHSFSLSPNDKGIFFLIESPMFRDTYIPVSDYEGFITFRNYNDYDLMGYGFKKNYKNIGKEIYNPLIALHGSPQILKLNEHEQDLLEAEFSVGSTDCAEYIIKNLQITQSNSLQNSTSYYVDFDIDIRSLNEVFQLRKSEITMEYSTSLLGENIVASNNITATLGGDFQNYTIGLFDAAPNKVTVNIEKILGQVANDVNTFQSKIYHASIYIQNFDLAGVLSLTVDENFDLKTFKEEGGNVLEIDCNQYNADITITIGDILAIDITSYNQVVYAGTKTLLTIEGENLINLNGLTEVWFYNAENADILEWVKPYAGDYKYPLLSDKIEVYVPSHALNALDGTNQNKEYAGTGKFKIVHKTNDIITEESTEQDITVTYAVRNKYYQFGSSGSETQPVMLTKDNGTNGYVVTYSTAFSTLQDMNGFYFKDAFGRALDTWCNTTGLNYVVDENALQTGNYDLLIDYGATNSTTALASTLVTDFYESDCAIQIDNGSPNHPETHEVDFIDNITMTFNSTIPLANWSAEMLNTGFNFSVEQVALHELGHAHGILHTNHLGELMYYAAGSAYTITSEASSSSNYLQNHSLNHNCANGPYAKRTGCTTGVIEVAENVEINSRYANGEIIMNSSYLGAINKINIYSVDGKLIKSVPNNQLYEIRIPFRNADGIYIVNYFSEYGVFSDKLLITK